MDKLKYLVLVLVIGCTSSFKHNLTSPEGMQIDTSIFAITAEQFSATVQSTLEAWQKALDASGHVCKPADFIKDLHVQFLPYPFVWNGKRYAGLTFVDKNLSQVGWREDLNMTALGHEMGHYILYRCHLPYDELNLFDWAKKYHLPY